MTQSKPLSVQHPQVRPQFPGYRPLAVGEPIFNETRKTWLVLRYKDVQRVLVDHQTFSSRRGGLTPATSLERNPGANMITMDPPQHQHHRMFFNEAFFSESIARLEPGIEADAHRLLDQVIERGSMDIIYDFAHTLSLNAITRLLGITIEDQEQFQKMSDVEITSPGSAQVQEALERLFAPVLEQRRKEPQDDLISTLMAAQMKGEQLSDAEIASSCGLILMAGHRSPRNLIGNAIMCLDALPEIQEEVQQDPTLLPGFVEEVIRYVPAFISAPRIATVDTLVGETQIKRGQWVMPQLGSANRDPAIFTDPEVFDIRRSPNPHVSFGHGVHLCVARPLARLDTTIGVRVLLERLKDIRVVHTVEPEPVISPVVYGMKHLPVTFHQA